MKRVVHKGTGNTGTVISSGTGIDSDSYLVEFDDKSIGTLEVNKEDLDDENVIVIEELVSEQEQEQEQEPRPILEPIQRPIKRYIYKPVPVPVPATIPANYVPLDLSFYKKEKFLIPGTFSFENNDNIARQIVENSNISFSCDFKQPKSGLEITNLFEKYYNLPNTLVMNRNYFLKIESSDILIIDNVIISKKKNKIPPLTLKEKIVDDCLNQRKIGLATLDLILLKSKNKSRYRSRTRSRSR